MENMYYVYIIKGDKIYYTGYTSDIEKRFLKHRKGGVETTKHMGNLILIGYFIKNTKIEAMKLERMIKRDGHIDHWINHESFIQHGGCSSVG
ncbi:MAG: GIY-YIG nuclease family protein [Candidatus Absconditabacterales bacterium]